MSNFTSYFWDWYIAIPVILSLVWILWILFKYSTNGKETEQYLDGKDFDGIREGNNPMPKWWVNSIVVIVLFSVVYLALYPGIASFKGLLGWSSIKELEAENKASDMKKYEIVQNVLSDVGIKVGTSDDISNEVIALSKNPRTLKMGYQIFESNCSSCHASDARGVSYPEKNIGFPNLRDSSWRWGGDVSSIIDTIRYGRMAAMPAFLGDGMLDKSSIHEVVQYVRSLAGSPHDESMVLRGKDIFSQQCSMCHGNNAKGNKIFGAPDLTAGIYLYGGDEKSITRTISLGRNGAMPAHEDILKDSIGSDTKLKLVSAYIYSFSKQK